MLRPLPLLVALVLFTSCDGTDVEAQRLFEDAALLSPVTGLTRTDARGRVLSRDAEDWRVGPSYLNTVSFVQVPYPNPVSRGDVVSFSVDVVVGVPGGLQVVALVRDPGTGGLELQPLGGSGADCPEAARSGVCQFVISASQIGLSGTGLVRLVVLDGRDGIVTYGDVEVR